MTDRRSRWMRVGVGIAFILGALPVGAQTVHGTLTGTVKDPTSAVIPGARVSLTEIETNRVYVREADGRGEFVFTLLPPGSYRIEAESAGFRKAEYHFELQVNQSFRLELALQLGTIAQEAPPVVASTEPLRVESATLGTVIENRKIRNLPLDGRNFLELALLAPGTAPAAQGTAGSVRGDFALHAGGGREDANVFLLDGAQNIDPKLNGVGVQPPVDAIREFEVLTNNYDASFGRNSGAQVNVATLSGSNEFHGTAYWFLRNAALDARNPFAPAGEPAPRYQRNQFGISLGGPLRRDRTFFFGDYESTLLREGITRMTRVPTLEEREGNFLGSELPVPMLPGFGPVPVIPQGFQHPSGRAIAGLYPEPNRTGAGANFVSSPTQRITQHLFNLRLDHDLTARKRLVARYSFVDSDLLEPFSGPTFAQVPGFGNDVLRRAQHLLVSHEESFGATRFNEVRFSFSRVAIGVLHENAGLSLNQSVGLPEISADPQDFGLSFIRISGFSPLGHEFNNPQGSAINNFQLTDHFSWVRGFHHWKFGAEFRASRQDAFRRVQSRGFLNFQGVFTGNPLADLLLGLPTVTGGARLDNPQQLRTESWNFFAQNHWRVSDRVTLSLGVRYEYNDPPVDARNRASLFDSTREEIAVVGTGNLPRSGYLADRNNFAPRAGLAWQLGARRDTVLRTGYGVYFDQTPLAPGEGLYFSPPFFDFRFFFSLPEQPPFFPGYTLTLSDPFPFDSFPLATPPSALTYQRNLRTPYVQHWNLSLQQRLGSKRVAEVVYVGSKGTKLLSARDINQPLPSPVFPNPRPLPQFDDIIRVESRASSVYHALQARFQQGYDFGLSLLASYTWSKSIDDASGFFPAAGDANFPQDSRTLAGERALSNFDLRQRFSLSFGYDFPYCREIGGRVSYSGLTSWIFGGWAAYGILTFQGGRPFTVALLPEVDNSNTGRSVLGFGANDRPNQVADPRALNPSVQAWFRTDAFEMPPFGSFGDASRNILEGPGLAVVNASLVKLIGAGERANLQFRVEAFNLLNRANYDLPDNFFGSPTFGQILSAGSPRRIQLGFKMIF